MSGLIKELHCDVLCSNKGLGRLTFLRMYISDNIADK